MSEQLPSQDYIKVKIDGFPLCAMVWASTMRPNEVLPQRQKVLEDCARCALKGISTNVTVTAYEQFVRAEVTDGYCVRRGRPEEIIAVSPDLL